jgi:ribosomal protein S1
MSRPEHSINESGWSEFVAHHGVDDIIDGHVVSIVPFGAFVRTDEGIDGLAPRSAWPTLPEPGSRVAVRITAIDVDNRRVAFGPA